VGKHKLPGIFLLLFLTTVLKSQDVHVEGYFLGDSVKIGEVMPYSLTVFYPRDLDVIFPDSTYDFAPFEYFDRYYFPTTSDSLVSFDSVVYELMTFEIDSVQFLQLPVFIKQEEDSAAIYSRQDSVILFHVIQQIPDSLNLKGNTALINVPGLVNYPVIFILIGIVIIIAIGVFLFFGKRISRWIRLYVMRRQYRKFIHYFYHQIGNLSRGQAGILPEDLLSQWKKYMERLEKEPYTKMTSKELIQLHADQRLKDNLRSIDRYIYGNVKDRPVHENFEKLLEYSKERYQLRVEEVQHG
jgi:hypothetical protein